MNSVTKHLGVCCKVMISDANYFQFFRPSLGGLLNSEIIYHFVTALIGNFLLSYSLLTEISFPMKMTQILKPT